ncbi:hypothetical protein PLEOSDRAFT_157676 [Pleurotus ostreatus PC15]|uniref:Uncharacterized protein n=1 Tax=Pleurotus ostreatus (strain PC15) TaxID=1137138 RepID=A0A067NXX1_PLEO1|nr:hypothetical protein PLEOSDRAFT_157676 [Pleurotus ostreatus PC15]
MAALDTSRHFRLTRKFLKLLTSVNVWNKWSQDDSKDATAEAKLEHHLFQAYNLRARPPTEQAQMVLQLSLQMSIRQCIFGEENRVNTLRLDHSTEDMDEQVFCFRYSSSNKMGFALYTFDEPERSRVALRDLYRAQQKSKFICTEDVLAHVEVSCVNITGLLHLPLVTGLVFRTDKKPVKAYTSYQRPIEHADEVRTVGDNGSYSTQDLLAVENGSQSLDCQEGGHEYEPERASMLLTDAQRRGAAMDDTAGGKGKRVEYYDTTPTSEGEEYLSSGDDTLAASSGMGSSTHSFFSGETHATGIVNTTKEDDAENKYEIYDSDDHGEDDVYYGVPTGGDSYHDDDGNENRGVDEDNEDTGNEGQEGSEIEQDVQEITGIDEFGVVKRRQNGPRFGYDNRTTIRARPVPSGAPRGLKRAPSKKVLRAFRAMLGIKAVA